MYTPSDGTPRQIMWYKSFEKCWVTEEVLNPTQADLDIYLRKKKTISICILYTYILINIYQHHILLNRILRAVRIYVISNPILQPRF